MAYKKYIKRNGKLYGPYIYYSRRVNGKVVSEYQGTAKKIDYKKFIFIFLGIVLVLGTGYGIVSNRTELTGNVVVDLDENYEDSERIMFETLEPEIIEDVNNENSTDETEIIKEINNELEIVMDVLPPPAMK